MPFTDPWRELHVVPTLDIAQHTFTRDCVCRPADDPDGDPIFYHNAFDGREEYAEGRARH